MTTRIKSSRRSELSTMELAQNQARVTTIGNKIALLRLVCMSLDDHILVMY